MNKVISDLIMGSKRKFIRNKQEKINLIYDTFFKLVLEQGYHKTSTNHIAESAEISIGTIYKYFPRGKEDIIRKYFEESMVTFFESHDLSKMPKDNISNFLDYFLLDLFKNHKENLGYNLAFRSAIQSDKTLYDAHKEKLLFFFNDLIRKLRKTNDNFKQFSERRLVDIFVFMYNLVNAILYHHLSVMEFFNTENEFIDYLSNITAFSLKYYLKT
jgi:AcrR family transcriptional regulator